MVEESAGPKTKKGRGQSAPRRRIGALYRADARLRLRDRRRRSSSNGLFGQRRVWGEEEEVRESRVGGEEETEERERRGEFGGEAGKPEISIEIE